VSLVLAPAKVCATAVTPVVVPSTECDVPSYFLVPSTAGVVYLVDGVVRDAGFRVNGPGTKVVTARAAEGYQLTNPTFSVSLVLAPAKVCATAVTPVVVPSTECDVPSYFLVPSTAGVVYLVDGVVRDAGFRVNGPGTKVVTARAAEGYQLTNPTFSVSLVLAPAQVCATAGPAQVTLSTECNVEGSFTVPTTTGVQYLLDGRRVASGLTISGRSPPRSS
jgi:serine protease